MRGPLPRLRSDIDVMPSPVADRPGLLLRDPFGYTNAVLVVPPPWIPVLQCLDGAHTELDAQTILTRRSGGVIVSSDRIRELVDVLRESGFLQTDEFFALKEQRHEAFRQGRVREPSHAGTAYPETGAGIEESFGPRLSPASDGATVPKAIAAPHVSPEGGFSTYRAAYDVRTDAEALTFVILGTSHFGAPERFGVTRKPFRTPLGTAEVALDLYEELVTRSGDAVIEEDYCHSPEHSIEFQVLFLQYRLGRPFRILPILCGPFQEALVGGVSPESVDSNRRFFDALSELTSRNPELHWVLGVDLAHIGRRYGHAEAVKAEDGIMQQVAALDRARLERIEEGDAEGLLELVHPGGDELNWCGFSTFYTFLHAVAPVERVRGELRAYEQWNIDPTSVVSFAAMHFERSAE